MNIVHAMARLLRFLLLLPLAVVAFLLLLIAIAGMWLSKIAPRLMAPAERLFARGNKLFLRFLQWVLRWR